MRVEVLDGVERRRRCLRAILTQIYVIDFTPLFGMFGI
jgi:hypothetical protein